VPAVPYTTHPGGGKETEAHASARAAVRAAATATRAALAPCDILQSPPPGGDQEVAANFDEADDTRVSSFSYPECGVAEP
jgi:hypothetical protein